MFNVLYRIRIENQFEWEMTQKLLFKLGYMWGVSGYKMIPYGGDKTITIWRDCSLSFGNFEYNCIPFSTLINMIENNEITIGLNEKYAGKS
jgi:hypothetical protein